MKIVAIRDLSDGNENVGEMWQETKIFDGDTPISEVVAWGVISWRLGSPHPLHRLTLTVPDGEELPAAAQRRA